MASIHSLPLEGDGIIENLYQYLWTKDELGQGPKLNIPDTVVYKYRQPAYWFFTSADGTIKKKNKANIINVRIEETFLKKESGSDVVAYYISTDDEGHTTIEYFTEDTFREFLYQRTKVNNGILQKFIEPRGVSNSMTRVIWSPKICLLERRQNRMKLHDTSIDLYKRVVTYDGEEHNSITVPVRGAILPAQVQAICEQMVAHVAEVSFQKYKISRMVLNLREDPSGKIWLLWCSSLRVDGVSHSEATAGPRVALPGRYAHLIKPPSKKGELDIGATVTVPSTVRLSDFSAVSTWGVPDPDERAKVEEAEARRKAEIAAKTKRSHRREDESEEVVDPRTALCPSCGYRVDLDRMHEVQYKTVISHYEQLLLLLGLKPYRANSASTGALPNPGAEAADAKAAGIPRECVWPDRHLVQSASGGVGIFGLYPDSAKEGNHTSRSTSGPRTVKLPLVHPCPPVLHTAHSKLSPTDFARFRQDPLFLYKTVNVCEDCFLVYSDIASYNMQGASAGSALERVMGRHAQNAARRRNVPLPVLEGARFSRAHAQERTDELHAARQELLRDLPPRPSRPATMSTIEEARAFYPAGQPALPKVVRNGESAASLAHSMSRSLDMAGAFDGEAIPDATQMALASREHAFFAALHQNPNLHKGHPLAHMLLAPGSAPTTLKNSASEPMVRGSRTSTSPNLHVSESNLETLGSTTQFKSSMPGSPSTGSLGAYRAMPLAWKEPGRKKKGKKSHRSQEQLTADKSAEEHAAFLQSMEEAARARLDNPDRLEDIVDVDVVKNPNASIGPERSMASTGYSIEDEARRSAHKAAYQDRKSQQAAAKAAKVKAAQDARAAADERAAAVDRKAAEIKAGDSKSPDKPRRRADGAVSHSKMYSTDGRPTGKSGKQPAKQRPPSPITSQEEEPITPTPKTLRTALTNRSEGEESALLVQVAWRIGDVPTMITARLLDESPSRTVITLDDSIAVDVSAFQWIEPWQGVPITPSAFSVTDELAGAETHNPKNFHRAYLSIAAQTEDGSVTYIKVIRCVVFCRPNNPDGSPPPPPVPAISAPLPHVIMYSRLLESLYFGVPPADAPEGSRAPLLVDEDFLKADALNPAGRTRPIMCHSRKIGDDVVIVSLHEAPPPSDGSAVPAGPPRFLLQAYNYTKRVFVAQHLSKEELLASDKPFLRQAAQVYFANIENQPSVDSAEA